jgi:deoxyribonuclease IV
MEKLVFGTAGIPVVAKGEGTVKGVSSVKELGLGAMEIEFVHSVNISEGKAPEIKAAAKKEKVELTCHAPYYINLNAAEPGKLKASMKRLFDAARISWLCGAKSVAFHPGFYLGKSSDDAYEKVVVALKEIVDGLKEIDCGIWVRPETMGKGSQFGSLKEVLNLCNDVDQVLPCIDYAHMHAREGKNNTLPEFNEILVTVEKELGKDALKNMHIQFAGVNYTDKGERNHMELKDSDLNYEDMVKSWKEFNIKGVAISESPNVEKDALLLKKLWNKNEP